MLSLSTNAVAAKAKSMYGQRLTKENYQELLRKRTVGEVAAYLRQETYYQDVLAEVRENSVHRGQLEQLLRKDFFLRCLKLLRYTGTGKQESFYRFGVRRQEIDLILNKIRMLNSDLYQEFAGDLPMYMEKYISFDLVALNQAKDFAEVLTVLKGTDYVKVLKSVDLTQSKQKIDYVSCERILNQYYCDKLIADIKTGFRGKTRKELLTIFESDIELQNISKIYRYKKFFNEDKKVIWNALTLTNQRMSKSFIQRLIDAEDTKTMMEILSTSSYRTLVDDSDYVFIEYLADQTKYHLSRRYMRFSTSAPMVYATYYIIQRLEVENIINIIEGVRYGTPSESIEKMLIY